MYRSTRQYPVPTNQRTRTSYMDYLFGGLFDKNHGFFTAKKRYCDKITKYTTLNSKLNEMVKSKNSFRFYIIPPLAN